MHPEAEASAVCKKCGKAMCQDCSSYSGHSGVCPSCRRMQFIAERAYNYRKIVRKFVWVGILSIASLGLAFWQPACLAGLLIPGIIVLTTISRIKLNHYLTEEINKIGAALGRGTGTI
jgi:hypothetical protein